MGNLAIVWPAILAAFSASFVEAVEAFTIVLAVSTFRGWRPAVIGAVAGLATLAIIVVLLGSLLDRIPLHALQVVIGVLLILFGTRWMRKAILRSAGIIEIHDETAAFAAETADLKRQASRARSLSWIAGLAAYKAILLDLARLDRARFDPLDGGVVPRPRVRRGFAYSSAAAASP